MKIPQGSLMPESKGSFLTFPARYFSAKKKGIFQDLPEYYTTPAPAVARSVQELHTVCEESPHFSRHQLPLDST